MRIYGIDFTSSPSRQKPITCAVCWLEGARLSLVRIDPLSNFPAFEALLASPGPWLAGLDFPFCQARRFLDGIAWPGSESWEGYVAHVGTLSRAAFRAELTAYRTPRADGDKHHHRSFDRLCGAQSPQTIDYTPVGLMFHEGAPRLRDAGVHLPGLRPGDRSRICVEAYPGVAARALAGRASYKSDTPGKSTDARITVRRAILAALTGAPGCARFGLSVQAGEDIIADPKGDDLDALLCAVQAAWAYRRGYAEVGPPDADPLEGWIADPAALISGGMIGAFPDCHPCGLRGHVVASSHLDIDARLSLATGSDGGRGAFSLRGLRGRLRSGTRKTAKGLFATAGTGLTLARRRERFPCPTAGATMTAAVRSPGRLQREMRLTAELVARVAREVSDPGPPPGFVPMTDEDYAALAVQLLDELGTDPFWVFTYGSLIWKPAFEFEEARRCIAHGWRRAFTLEIRRWRGSDAQPGLMLSLDRGGSCTGLAYRMPPDDPAERMARLLKRELPYRGPATNVRWLRVRAGPETFRALAFYAVPRDFPLYVDLPVEEQAARLARAVGHGGSGAEYLFNTVLHLEQAGIHDSYLWQLQRLVADEILTLHPLPEGPNET